MTLEEINALAITPELQTHLEQRLKDRDREIIDALEEDEEYVITGEELDAELIIYKAELHTAETERLRVLDLKDRILSLNDLGHAHSQLHPSIPNAKLHVKQTIIEADPATAETLMQILEAKDASLHAAINAVAYINQRKSEYPSIEELVVSLFEEDVEEQTRLEALRQAIKLKYPKV